MDKYTQAEFELAEALGLKPIVFTDGVYVDWKVPRIPCEQRHGTKFNPCSDWGVCGPLMVEHDIFWRMEDWAEGKRVACIKYGDHGPVVISAEWLKNHPTKDLAVMYAIVQAITAKLKQ